MAPHSSDSASQISAGDNTRVVGSQELDELKLLAGHLGHLTDRETAALELFRQRLTEAKLYIPASFEHPKASHTDTTLL